jgi:hypothetical protein
MDAEWNSTPWLVVGSPEVFALDLGCLLLVVKSVSVN